MKKRSLFICVVIKNPCGLRIIHSNTVLDWMTIISLFKIYNSKLWLLEMIFSVVQIIAETMKVQKRVLFTPVMDRVWTVWDRSVSCSWWRADYSPLGARSWSVMVLPFEVTVCNCNVIPSELSALYVSLVKTVLLIVPCLFKKAQTQTCKFSAWHMTFKSKPASPENQTELSFSFFFFFLLLCQSIFCVECCDITCGRDQLNFNLFLRMWWTAENIQEQQMPAECEQNNVRRNIVDIAALVALTTWWWWWWWWRGQWWWSRSEVWPPPRVPATCMIINGVSPSMSTRNNGSMSLVLSAFCPTDTTVVTALGLLL